MRLGRIHTHRQRIPRPQLHKRLGLYTVWHLIRRLAAKEICVKTACEWLGVSRSRLYELKSRWENVSESEISQARLYDRSRPPLLPPEARSFLADELEFMKKESQVLQGHVNFALLAQECHKRFGRRFHRNTIRRWAIREKLYDPEKDQTGKAFTRFERGGIGMLFQHDASSHLWVPKTGRASDLILTIDDHSRKIVGALLVPQETSFHHLCVLRETFETYGLPLAYYTDNFKIFTPQTDTTVQFGRVLKALEIALTLSRKAQPQARGKVEKRFDYLQRRIPFLCEKYNVSNLTWANRILKDEVDYFNEYHIHEETKEIPNRRWKRALEEGRTYLRPLSYEGSLDILFGLHFNRSVTKDGFVKFGGRKWPVPNAPRWGEATVVLRPPTGPRRPHTELTVLYKGGSQHFVLSKGTTNPQEGESPHP